MNNFKIDSSTIESIVSITKKIHELKREDIKYGKYINVFNLWNEFSGITEPIHSRILHFFLSPHPMHGQGNLFLGLFLKRIGINIQYGDEWVTTAEIGRVDVMLKRFHPRSVVIIENKSNWAGDQSNQLYRYWYENIHHCKDDCYSEYYESHPEYKIVYLVPNKSKSVSNFSLKRPEEYNKDLPPLLPLKPITFSYDEDIYEWLNECINAISPDNNPLINLISQYKSYCKNL